MTKKKTNLVHLPTLAQRKLKQTHNELAVKAATEWMPRLTFYQLDMLESAPYDDPVFIPRRKRRNYAMADGLVSCGLLEKNPTGDAFWRTELGSEVLRLWFQAGW